MNNKVNSQSLFVSKLLQEIACGREDEGNAVAAAANTYFIEKYEEADRILSSDFTTEDLDAINLMKYPKLDFTLTRSLRTGNIYFANLYLQWNKIRRGTSASVVKTPESEVLAAFNVRNQEIVNVIDTQFSVVEREQLGPIVKYSNVNKKIFQSRRRGDEYFQELSSNWTNIERSNVPTIITDMDESSRFLASLSNRVQTTDMVFGGDSIYWMIPEYSEEERRNVSIKGETSRKPKTLMRLHRNLMKRLIQDNPKPTCDYDKAMTQYSEFLESLSNSEELLQKLVASGILQFTKFL